MHDLPELQVPAAEQILGGTQCVLAICAALIAAQHLCVRNFISDVVRLCILTGPDITSRALRLKISHSVFHSRLGVFQFAPQAARLRLSSVSSSNTTCAAVFSSNLKACTRASLVVLPGACASVSIELLLQCCSIHRFLEFFLLRLSLAPFEFFVANLCGLDADDTVNVRATRNSVVSLGAIQRVV